MRACWEEHCILQEVSAVSLLRAEVLRREALSRVEHFIDLANVYLPELPAHPKARGTPFRGYHPNPGRVSPVECWPAITWTMVLCAPRVLASLRRTKNTIHYAARPSLLTRMQQEAPQYAPAASVSGTITATHHVRASANDHAIPGQ